MMMLNEMVTKTDIKCVELLQAPAAAKLQTCCDVRRATTHLLAWCTVVMRGSGCGRVTSTTSSTLRTLTAWCLGLNQMGASTLPQSDARAGW